MQHKYMCNNVAKYNHFTDQPYMYLVKMSV